MAYAYEDTHQGSEMDVKDHPDTKLAGDVIDISAEMRNMQQSNAYSRAIEGRASQQQRPKAPVVKLVPKAS